MMTAAKPTFRVLGVTDDRTACECCGKSNLKVTVALDVMDDEGNGSGEVVYYGRDCASKVLHGNNKAGNVKGVELLGKSISYAKKWLRHTDKHTAALLASKITVWGYPCYPVGEYALKFNNGVVVSA